MTARRACEDWPEAENLPDYLQRQLKELGQSPARVDDVFGTDINFGTAGMRGLPEPGANRISVVTVGRATEGLAQSIEKEDQGAKEKGVVISFDSWYHSEDFAKLSAQVLGYHGIRVYLFDSLRPTPELSSVVRRPGIFADIMVTASHNAKRYNGYKIYDADSGQMPPGHVTAVGEAALEVGNQLAIPVSPTEESRAKDILQLVGEDVDEAYLEALDTVNVNHDLTKETADKLKIVYTPVHGTGKVTYDRAFRQGGFKNFTVVPSQAIIGPEFPTTIEPNPEYRQVFDEGAKVADRVGADVTIVADPDVNRSDAAVRAPNGDFQALIGNQIATLISNYLLTNLKNSGKLNSSYKIVTSVISSSLPFRIAKSFGIQAKYVLTGFKYIGEEIGHLHRIGDGQFLVGFEESYGFLFKTFNRDKDAMQGALMFFKVTACYASGDMSVLDGLQEIWNKCGASCEITKAIEVPGLDGQKRVAKVMENLRKEQLKEINGHKIIKVEGFELAKEATEIGEGELAGFPESDVLKYFLGDETWVTLRPSGTEPVIKAYIGTNAKIYAKTEEKCKAYHDAIAKSTK